MSKVLRVVPSAHIMACAPSNSAADLLAERLLLHVPAAQLFRLNAGSRSIITVPECIKVTMCTLYCRCSDMHDILSSDTHDDIVFSMK